VSAFIEDQITLMLRDAGETVLFLSKAYVRYKDHLDVPVNSPMRARLWRRCVPAVSLVSRHMCRRWCCTCTVPVHAPPSSPLTILGINTPHFIATIGSCGSISGRTSSRLITARLWRRGTMGREGRGDGFVCPLTSTRVSTRTDTSTDNTHADTNTDTHSNSLGTNDTTW